jgi:hypothetical protein
MEGLSVRTLYINFICNAIVFLYLLDNDTSWLVLVSAAIGLLIEAWKITRAVHIKVFQFTLQTIQIQYQMTAIHNKWLIVWFVWLINGWYSLSLSISLSMFFSWCGGVESLIWSFKIRIVMFLRHDNTISQRWDIYHTYFTLLLWDTLFILSFMKHIKIGIRGSFQHWQDSFIHLDSLQWLLNSSLSNFSISCSFIVIKDLKQK